MQTEKDVPAICPQCIYRVPGGLMIYCEKPEWSKQGITFPGASSAVIAMGIGPQGPVLNITKLSASPLLCYPSSYFVPKEKVEGIGNCSNFEVLKAARQTVSSLVLVQ